MSLATLYFQKQWESVADVSARASFDLLCTGPQGELHVEVKGTTGEGRSVILTRGEANDSNTIPYRRVRGCENRSSGRSRRLATPHRRSSHPLFSWLDSAFRLVSPLLSV